MTAWSNNYHGCSITPLEFQHLWPCIFGSISVYFRSLPLLDLWQLCIRKSTWAEVFGGCKTPAIHSARQWTLYIFHWNLCMSHSFTVYTVGGAKGGGTGGARGAIAPPKIALWGSALRAIAMCYLLQFASPSAPPISYCFLRHWVELCLSVCRGSHFQP